MSDAVASEKPESKQATLSNPGSARRNFLVGAGAVVATGLAGKLLYEQQEGFASAKVYIGKAASYEIDLSKIVEAGLEELGLGRAFVKGKSVLLKPNLVEPTRVAPHINTHPAMVRAAAEAFRRLDAKEVFVAEGQGHIRDSYLVLEQSGLGKMLEEASLEFVDLNHDEVFAKKNLLNITTMKQLQLPATLKRADIIVSMPKLKIHHWAGVTLSMKNLFGVMPGICYGWPKNVLHAHGIEQSILDINATVKPTLAIVDGIVGMEGDGPIMGTPRQSGLIVIGQNFPAVDATGARLMGIDPEKISYLKVASSRLGPIKANHIQQIGESVASMTQKYHMLDHPHFNQWRSDG